jgi:hypothetical protein
VDLILLKCSTGGAYLTQILKVVEKNYHSYLECKSAPHNDESKMFENMSEVHDLVQMILSYVRHWSQLCSLVAQTGWSILLSWDFGRCTPK